MPNMPSEPLTPAQVKAVQRSLAHCNDCQPDIDFLKAIGYDLGGDDTRCEHLRRMGEAALDYHARAKANS